MIIKGDHVVTNMFTPNSKKVNNSKKSNMFTPNSKKKLMEKRVYEFYVS